MTQKKSKYAPAIREKRRAELPIGGVISSLSMMVCNGDVFLISQLILYQSESFVGIYLDQP